LAGALPAAAWRSKAADALESAGLVKQAAALRNCGHDFFVDVCTANVADDPKIVPKNCHLPFCLDCARREQARKLARYVSVIWDMVNLGQKGYSLKHLTMTTPFDLRDENARRNYQIGWRWVTRAVRRILFKALKMKKMLTDEEKDRGEVDLKARGIGYLIAAEFGEKGHKLHFHIIIYCPYLDIKNVIVPIWQAVSGGKAQVCYITAVDDVEAGLLEVTKYVTKFDALDPDLVPALAKVLKHHRSFRSFGVLHDIPEIEERPYVCDKCGAKRKLVGGSAGLPRAGLDYLQRCIAQNVPPDDEILAQIEARLGFSTDLEISRGKNEIVDSRAGHDPPS